MKKKSKFWDHDFLWWLMVLLFVAYRFFGKNDHDKIIGEIYWVAIITAHFLEKVLIWHLDEIKKDIEEIKENV